MYKRQVIHCHKYKKTKNIESTIVQTTNGLYRIGTKCAICQTNKSKFVSKPEEETKQNTTKLTKEEAKVKAKEIHAQVRKKLYFLNRKIITLRIEDLWAANIVIMSNYVDQNDNYSAC